MGIGKLFVLFVLCFYFLGCSKSGSNSGSADNDGNCNSETVNTYNDVLNKSDLFVINKDIEYLKGVDNSCKKFQSLMGSSTCKAKNIKTNETTEVNSTSLKKICEVAEKYSSPSVNSNSELPVSTPPQPLPKHDTANDVENKPESESMFCNSNTIQSFNNVIIYSLNFQEKPDKSNKILLIEKCENFKSAIGNSTCFAKNTKTGEQIEISLKNVEKWCVNENSISPTPDESIAISKLSKGLVFEIKNSKIFNSLLNSKLNVIQSGELKSKKSQISDNFCYLASKNKKIQFVEKQSLSFKYAGVVNKQMRIDSASEEISIFCSRLKTNSDISEKDLTVREFQNIFSSTIRLISAE